MVSEIICLLSETAESIGDFLSNLIFTKERSFSLIGSILLVFAGISFSFFICVKVFKFFGVRFKRDSIDEDLSKESNKKVVDIVEEHDHIKNDYHCAYCGSVTNSNKKNCRNCGSDEFIEGR